MKIFGSGHSVITILLLLTPVRGLVTKMRLCVEYKKENYLAKGEYITTSHANTEHKCMIKCMRHYPCTAFNYHAVNKTCILMPELWCMSPSSLNDTRYLLVQLNPCKQQPVFTSIRPEERGWSWVTTDDPSNNADILKLPGFNNRDISRTLYHGYYLPGFWRGDGEGFRAVDPVIMQVTKCASGEFLALSDSSFQWASYTAGDAVPDCALPVTLLPNGMPMYTVRYPYVYGNGNKEQISGFYIHATKTTYFVKSGVINPRIVDILCGIDAWNTTFEVSLLQGGAVKTRSIVSQALKKFTL